jgi:hypothetical protein
VGRDGQIGYAGNSPNKNYKALFPFASFHAINEASHLTKLFSLVCLYLVLERYVKQSSPAIPKQLKTAMCGLSTI